MAALLRLRWLHASLLSLALPSMTPLFEDFRDIQASSSGECLLQLGTSPPAAGPRRHRVSLLHSKKDLPAGWFGSFSKGESTFDEDDVDDHPENPALRDAARVSEHGNSVNLAAQKNPEYMQEDGLPYEWFEESKSGGMAAAWRTKFPQLEAIRNDGIKMVPWLPDRSSSARGKQTLVPAAATSFARAFYNSHRKEAEWFENAVGAYDDFGRNRPPSERSDRFFWDWEEKSWTVPFGCPDPGCIANATLETFDAKALQHRRCRLSIGVHATDYDDEYSREHVEWFNVNGNMISTRCDPMAKGCNTSVRDEDRGLHPCVSDYPLDHLLGRQGAGTDLRLSGKITDMVDECPVGNNLLSGEARMTCMVKPWPVPTPAPDDDDRGDGCSNATALQCSAAGCTANAIARFCRPPKEGEKCTLSVRIWQTDFDNDHGSREVVEWVKVNGAVIATEFNPGRNPCKEVYQGKAPANNSLNLTTNAGSTIETETPEDPTMRDIGLDAQSAAILASIPGDGQTGATGCRRRVNDLVQSESLYWRNEGEDEDRPMARQHPIDHLRAAPDVMKDIVVAHDITTDAFVSESIVVEAKISDRVDECAKDGYLLNAEVLVECK